MLILIKQLEFTQRYLISRFRGCLKRLKSAALPPNPPPVGDFRSDISGSKSPIHGGFRGRFRSHRRLLKHSLRLKGREASQAIGDRFDWGIEQQLRS
jgi:hypothetical protein